MSLAFEIQHAKGLPCLKQIAWHLVRRVLHPEAPRPLKLTLELLLKNPAAALEFWMKQPALELESKKNPAAALEAPRFRNFF